MCDKKEAGKVIAIVGLYLCMEKEKNRRKRIWMKEWLYKRNKRSHVNLLKELKETSPNDLKNFLRMNAEVYEELLNLVRPSIEKKNTVMRMAITPNERLSATLRFLASGQSFADLKFLTNISASSLSKIIMETCEAIILALKPFLKLPNNEEEWKAVAADFEKKWNFDHCIGSIDGKHVNIVKPENTGSYYFNYK